MGTARSAGQTQPRALADKDPNAVASPATKQQKDAPKSGDPSSTGTKRKADASAGDTKGPEGSEAKPPPKKRSKATNGDKKSGGVDILDVGHVQLPGEESGLVPVYETCDTIRRKIRDVLKKPGVTQAGFCRALGKYGALRDDISSPPPRQLARFLEKKGPMKGNMNIVFYPSYVLFEKMRIRDGKPKTKFRKEMEEKHGEKGVDVEKSMDGPFIMHISMRACVDRWGKFHTEKKPSYC